MNALKVKPRSRAGTWDTFVRRYAPLEVDDGAVIRDWSDAAVQSADERLLWTVVDCDGRLYVVPGLASVNYMGRVVCSVPWDDVEFSNPGYVY